MKASDRFLVSKALVLRCVLPAFALLGLFGLPQTGTAAVDHLEIIPESTSRDYSVNQDASFWVEAHDAAHNLVTDYNEPVTFRFYDGPKYTAPVPSYILSDPAMLIWATSTGGATAIGTAISGQTPADLTWSGGRLNISVRFKSGFDSGIAVVESPSAGATYAMPPYNVKGFSEYYFLQDLDGDYATAGIYDYAAALTVTDVLNPFSEAVTGSPSRAVTVPGDIYFESTGLSGSLAYAVTGITAGYSAGGAGVTANLWVNLAAGSDANLRYAVIIDYDGNLADFDNPDPDGTSGDSLYVSPNVSSYPTDFNFALATANLNWVSGPLVGSVSQMNAGKVIVRVWNQSSTSTCTVRVVNDNPAQLSNISIPFSSSNVLPVQGDILNDPKEVLTGASAIPVTYTIQNQSNRAVSIAVIRVPAGGSTTPWSVVSVDVPSGCSSSVSSATLSDSGAVTLVFSSPLTVGGSAGITLHLNVPDEDRTNWRFDLDAARDPSDIEISVTSSGAYLNTFGKPPAPAPVTVLPSLYTTVGNQVALAWSQVTTQGCNGYVLSRRSPAGSGAFTAFATIGSNTITADLDNTAVNGTSYDYTVQSKNNVATSDPVTAGPVTPFTNPASVTGLQALSRDGAVSLSWNAATAGTYAVSGYRIYRDTAAPASIYVTTVAGTSYDDTTVSAGVTYHYRVRAVDSQYSGTPEDAHIGDWSGWAEGFPPGYPPRNLTGTLDHPETITLNWAAPVALNSTAPVSYRIYRHEAGAPIIPGDLMATVAGGLTSYPDTNPVSFTAGTSFQYLVEAVLDEPGYPGTNPSNTVTVFIVPTAPSNLAASSSTAAVTLTWDSLASQSVDEYRVEWMAFPPSTPVTVSSITGVTYIHAATPGVDYRYRVSAHNSGGWGEWSAPVTSAVLPPIATGLSALSGSDQAVTLSWAAPPYTNITSYDLYRDTDPVFAGATAVTTATTLSSHTDPGLSGGVTLYYFLVYRNAGGTGLPSNPVSLIVPPDAPTGLTASSSGSAISITWNAMAQGVTAYYVYSSPTDPNPYDLGPSARVTTVSVPSWGETPAPGSKRYYQVTAVNGGTGLPGGESQPTGAVTELSPPGVPASVAVTYTGALNDRLQVGWAALTGQSVTQYHIYRDGSYLASTTGTSYTDNGTATLAGSIFGYAVQADNDDGSIGGLGNTSTVVYRMVPPTAPGGVTADIVSGSISLSWNPNPGGESVTQYKVWASTGDPDPYQGGAGTVVTMVGPGQTFYVETATPGALRYFVVTAVNGNVTVAGGESVTSALATQLAPPAAPTGLSVTFTGANRDQAALTWAPPSGTVTDYHVYRGGTNIASTGGVTTYLDPSPGAYGSTVYYQVAADNDNGTIGGASALSSPAVTVVVPPRPITLNAAGVSSSSDTAVTLSWGPELSQGVTGYAIYRSYEGGTFVRILSVPSASSDATTVFGNTMRGRNYSFLVRAVNSGGEGASATTLTVTIPASPTTITTADSGFAGANPRVDLAWNPNPLSEAVTGYRIYRHDAEGPIQDYNLVGNVPSSDTTYTDNTLTEPPSVYWYLVKAVSAGVESRSNTWNARAVTAYRPPQAAPAPTLTTASGAVTLIWPTAGVATSYPVTTWVYYVSEVQGVLGTPVTLNASAAALAVTVWRTGMTNGVPYYFRVQALDTEGHAGEIGFESGATPVLLPGAPTLTAVNNTTDELAVLWEPGSPGTLPVSIYTLYRDSEPWSGFSAVATIQGWLTGYGDHSVSAGVTYAYRVQAVDGAGNPSGYSNALTQVLSASVTLPAPQNVRLRLGDGAVTLQWSAAYDPTSSITNTVVFRSAGGGAYAAAVTLPVGDLQYLEPSPVNGTVYAYYLRSMAGLAPSEVASAAVTGRPAAPPGAPGLQTPVDGDGYVTLTWSNPSTVDNVPVTGVLIECSTGVSVFHPASVNICTRTGLSNGQTYVFSARAYNANGTAGPASSPVTGFPYVLTAPQSVAAGVTVGAGPVTGIRVAYEAPAVSSFPVAGYRVYCSTVPGSYGPVTATLAEDVRAWTHWDTGTETRLYYAVRAFDVHGHVGPYSAVVNDRATAPPQAPSTVRLTSGDDQMLVDWPESVPGTLPVSFYVVSRNGTAAATVTGERTWWLDIPTADGAPLTYTVTAYDEYLRPDVDAHASSPTAAVTGTSVDNGLNPPTGLEALALGDTSIRLTWERPNELGRSVTGYAVLQSTTPLPAAYPVTLLPGTGPEVLVFDVTGLEPGTRYHFSVIALDAVGMSGYSNEADAVTDPRTRAIPSLRAGGQALLDRNIVRPRQGQKLGIFFRLDVPADVEVRIYNVNGDLMTGIHYGPAPAGQVLNLDWDVKDRVGSIVSSGVYLVEVKAGPMRKVLKVAVIR